MSALATIMVVCCVFWMQLLAAEGVMDSRAVNWWSLFALGGLVAALVSVRSGFSERLSDPSLTLFQMQWALTWNAVAYVLAGPVGSLLLPVLIIILMFGIFERERRHTIFLMVYSMAIYALAVIAAAYLESPRPTPAVFAARLTVVLLSLFAGTMMCLKVQTIRARSRLQKRRLEDALVQIRDLAMRDELTGLFNRRQMTVLMNVELRRSQRRGRPFLLAQLDIDNFKNVNDQHGHAAGDQALKAFGDLVGSKLRSGDVLARWGGEEFVLLLSDTRMADAAALLERARRSLEKTEFQWGNSQGRITVSIGWTAYHQGEDLEATLARADEALYRAKREGRNRVVLAQVPETETIRRRASTDLSKTPLRPIASDSETVANLRPTW